MENQREVWNEIAKDWSRKRTRTAKFVEEFLKNCEGRVVYLGCGSGRNFVKTKAEMYAVDFSEKMVEEARKNAEQKKLDVRIKVAEADKTGFSAEFFDKVVCISVLHCIPGEEKRKAVFREIWRILKDGGEAFVSVWGRNSKRVRNKPKECFVPWGVGNKKVERYTYLFEKGEIEQMARNAGFEVEKVWEDENINLVLKKALSPERNDKTI